MVFIVNSYFIYLFIVLDQHFCNLFLNGALKIKLWSEVLFYQ